MEIKPIEEAEFNLLDRQAQVIARSGLAPNGLDATKIVTIALKGRELGIPPLQALNHIHVIQGKPTISAELMRALVLRAGHKVYVREADGEKAVLEGARWDPHIGAYGETVTVSFTMQDANNARLTGKDNWRKFPRAMLVARATSIICREHFADVLMGTSYTAEELDPNMPVDEHGAPLVEDSHVFDQLPPTTAEVVAQTVYEDDPPQYRTAPTAKQFAAFHAILNDYEIAEHVYRSSMQAAYGVDSVKELTFDQLSKLIYALQDPEKVMAFIEKGQQSQDDS